MYRVRCSKCEARRTLAKHPEEYLRVPSCPRVSCARQTRASGLRQRWRVDSWRHLHEIGVRGCECRGHYTFPHRRGSKWCEHNTKWSAEDAERQFGNFDGWRDDPLCFGRRPVGGEEPPF